MIGRFGSALLSLACAAASSPRQATPSAGADRGSGADLGVRNVLLVVVDTLRADHLSCYGYPRRTSPCIDRFAAEGVRFERAYTAWPETCQSMAAILSGMWCQTNGVVIDTPQAISTEIDLFPEVLQRRGFRTAAFVTNPVLPRSNRFDQGFDRYVEAWNKADNPRRSSETDLACAWLRENAEGPFFLWVHLIEPHAPYGGRYPERFVGDSLYDPTRRVTVHADTPKERFKALGGFPGFSRIEGRDELAYYVARYDADVFDADAKVGRLLEQLAATGAADRTLVILVADHGEGLGEHDYFWHGHVPYDETAHVPLVIRGPGIGPGVAGEVVSTVDLAPTILELAGIADADRPKLLEGRSLVPWLRDPTLRTGRVVFTESGDDRRGRDWQRTVRNARFKLVHVPSERERDELGLEKWNLFDVERDPAEMTDASAAHPEVLARLKDELLGWMRSEPLFQATRTDLPEAELQKIRELGYATESDAETKDSAGGG